MRKILRNIDKKLLLVTIILFVFGLIMILSSSGVKAYMFGNSTSIYFKRQLLFLIISFVPACILIFIPTSKYKRLSWPALIGIIGLLILVLLYAIAINETRGWLNIGNYGGQPSELAKIVIIVWLSYFYGSNSTCL